MDFVIFASFEAVRLSEGWKAKSIFWGTAYAECLGNPSILRNRLKKENDPNLGPGVFISKLSAEFFSFFLQANRHTVMASVLRSQLWLSSFYVNE